MACRRAAFLAASVARKAGAGRNPSREATEARQSAARALHALDVAPAVTVAVGGLLG